jgi:hypothetical protein
MSASLDNLLKNLQVATNVQDTTPYVEYIFKKIGPNLSLRINPMEIPNLIKEGMELVEKFKNNLSGDQRKGVLISVMKKAVDGSPMDDEQKKWCNIYLDFGASTTIDVICSVAKGLTNINKECCRSFWCCGK